MRLSTFRAESRPKNLVWKLELKSHNGSFFSHFLAITGMASFADHISDLASQVVLLQLPSFAPVVFCVTLSIPISRFEGLSSLNVSLQSLCCMRMSNCDSRKPHSGRPRRKSQQTHSERAEKHFCGSFTHSFPADHEIALFLCVPE